MLETLTILPVSFWAVVFLLLAGGLWAAGQVRAGLGLPMLAVLATVAAWYPGDAFYNDYAHNHAVIFNADVLDAAWWQVAWFLLAFLLLCPVMHHWLNSRHIHRSSQMVGLMRTGVMSSRFQSQMNQLFWGCATVWLVLVLVAAVRLGTQLPYYFFPFLGYKSDPWGRGRVGGGFDAVLSLFSYFQTFVVAGFGVVAALAQDRRVRNLALVGCLLTLPYYIFDRNRNVMLVVVLPAVLSWVFLRLRGSLMQKIVILAVCFLLVSAWFKFVIANRSQTSITDAIQGGGVTFKEANAGAHQEGLNMYEELCWINALIREDTYKPDWGERYFAELVNPIPRTLWPGKPMIGIDYAAARGQTKEGGYDSDTSGVYATISTGMIGQGVVNFGRIIGPAFAAFLMSLWTAWLARTPWPSTTPAAR